MSKYNNTNGSLISGGGGSVRIPFTVATSNTVLQASSGASVPCKEVFLVPYGAVKIIVGINETPDDDTSIGLFIGSYTTDLQGVADATIEPLQIYIDDLNKLYFYGSTFGADGTCGLDILYRN